MERIDCSKALNYKKELDRMCKHYGTTCELCCPFYNNAKCKKVEGITEEAIKIVQKWSDEHPRQTQKEKFKKMMENNGFADFNYKCSNCSFKCPYCVQVDCDSCVKYWNSYVD